MKKLLVCLTILFSVFLFTNKIRAEELSDFCEYTSPCLSTENISTLTTSENYLIVVGDGYPTTEKLITVITIEITDYENDKFHIWYDQYNNPYYRLEGDRSLKFRFKFLQSEAPIDLTGTFTSQSVSASSDANKILSYSQNIYAYYSTVDLYDTEGNLVFEAGLHNEEEEPELLPFDNTTNIFENFNLTGDEISSYFSSNFDNFGFGKEYDSYFIYIAPYYDKYAMYYILFNSELSKNGNAYINYHEATGYQFRLGSEETKLSFKFSYGAGYNIQNISSLNDINFSTYNVNSDDFSDNISGINTNSHTSNIELPVYYLTNVDIYNKYTDSWINKNIITPTSYDVTFHLNGGKIFDSNEICDDIGCYIIGSKYENYSSTIKTDGLFDYLINQEVEKETMQFVGWYYDEKLTKKVEATDILDSDKNFYAKYQYKNVEDFLNNNTFNNYTFDENYQYAVISLNDQTNRDIYLGLELMSYNFEVYKYNKINLEYNQGASLCLVPIFSKDNKYYYHLDSPLNEDYEVLILPKEKLQDKYNFLLSSNAYVTYTNDLKQVIIKDENGNDITTDLENSYDYSQDTLLNNENDLLEIFKDLINNKDNNVFSYFNQVWNVIKQNKLFIYFITLIIGALIILIIKTASR